MDGDGGGGLGSLGRPSPPPPPFPPPPLPPHLQPTPHPRCRLQPQPPLQCKPAQPPPPSTASPLGYIEITDGTLHPFGVFPPSLEAAHMKDVKLWREVKVVPGADILGASGVPLFSHAFPLLPALRGKSRGKSAEAQIRTHLLAILEEQRLNSRSVGGNNTTGANNGGAYISNNSGPSVLPENLPIRFYCNQILCYTGLQMFDSSRAFLKFKYLKQHYLKVHAPKRLGCSNCDKQFATLALLGVHMKSCGGWFECSVCSTAYPSLEALQTHCRRKKHSFDMNKYQTKIQKAKEETMALREADRSFRKQQQLEEGRGRSLGVSMSVSLPLIPISLPLLSRPSSTLTCCWGLQQQQQQSPQQQSPQILPQPEVSSGKVTVASVSTQTEQNHGLWNIRGKGDRGVRRKRCAETQTGLKCKISTETQTLNIRKRRRTSKKQIAEAETQCTSTTNLINRSSKEGEPKQNEEAQADPLPVQLQVLMSHVGIHGSSDGKEESSEPLCINQERPVAHEGGVCGLVERSEVATGTSEEDGLHEHSDRWIQWEEFNILDQPQSEDYISNSDQAKSQHMMLIFSGRQDSQETQTDPLLTMHNALEDEDGDDQHLLNLVTAETQTQGSMSTSLRETEQGLADIEGLQGVDLNLSHGAALFDSFSQADSSLEVDADLETTGRSRRNRSSPSFLETIDGETQTQSLPYLLSLADNHLYDFQYD